MKLSRLFRRDPAASSLRERAAATHERADALREGLSRRDAVLGSAVVTATVPLPAVAAGQPAPLPVERAEYRARLLAAYEEDRLRRPISMTAEGGSVEERAGCLVGQRLWNTAREILALPPPTTFEGLGLAALASSVLIEGNCPSDDPTDVAAAGLTRAVLALTGTPALHGFAGFGDEPDFREREEILWSGSGSLPAWAIAEAKGQTDEEPDA